MEITRLHDYMYKQLEQCPLERSFNRVTPEGILSYSTQSIINKAERLASGLLDLGIKPGDKVAIVAYKNRPEWVIVDLACLISGIVSVPLYPTISAHEYSYILREADVVAAIVGDGDLKDKIITAGKEAKGLLHIFSMSKLEGMESIYDISSGEKLKEIYATRDAVTPDDLATIIYTSGTTGNPKGVMLTHRNIITAVRDTLESFPLDRGVKVLSFLPYCHIFERACIYGYTDACVEVYCTGTDNLGGETGDLQRVKPHFFTTVPRLLEKVYDKIYAKGLELTGVKRKLFFWALSLTEDYEYDKVYSFIEKSKRKLADRLIFSKWREALGGNVKGIVTGAAPCPRKMAQVFSAAGIPIMEGYGLTETSPTLTINRFDGQALLGSVGVPIASVDIIIDEEDGQYGPGEGEILAHGPNVMQGYYRQPEKTAAVFKEVKGKQYFKTGDIGKFVQGPKDSLYLFITDRKKELLKTSGGKYVAPAPIENKLREHFLVEQAMVIGDQKKYVSALIIPSKDALIDWAKHKNLNTEPYETMLKDEKVKAKFQEIVDETNPHFSHIEQVKKFTLLPNEWIAETNDGSEPELTPTMKLKRRVIRQKYAAEIAELYEHT